jgi:hypothetical protein
MEADMGDDKTGPAFITHEYDEAIAVQRCIVDAETALAKTHPRASSKKALKSALTDDKAFLTELTKLGRTHGASGKVEDVAGGLKELMEDVLETATNDGSDSDYYEAHAVLLNINRKQMDAAGGMLEIARATKDAELRKAATSFAAAQKASCQVLADELGAYAAHIATASA